MTAYIATYWGGFGATMATAAATLTGLLFIAVSINLRQILDNRPLPGRAAQTLIFFALPLAAALLLVVPAQATAALGWELIATALVVWTIAMVIDRRAGRSPEEPSWSWLLTRVIPMAVACACLFVAGVSLLALAGGGLYWVVPAAILAIAAGLANTWVLMIEIMR
jgi:hypothetical protein